MTFVLVAKTLTKSDTQGRVILPRVAVEANLAFIVGYRYSSACIIGMSQSTKAPCPIQSGKVNAVMLVHLLQKAENGYTTFLFLRAGYICSNVI